MVAALLSIIKQNVTQILSISVLHFVLLLKAKQQERVGTLGKGRDETFVTNMSSVLSSVNQYIASTFDVTYVVAHSGNQYQT